jgi:hypothetical protein
MVMQLNTTENEWVTSQRLVSSQVGYHVLNLRAQRNDEGELQSPVNTDAFSLLCQGEP